VLFNAVEDAAQARGWLAVAETATPGFLTRLTDDPSGANVTQF
jgi:hypothetical protein